MTTTVRDKLIRHQILIQRLAQSEYESMIPFIDNAVDRAFLRLGNKRYLSSSEARSLELELNTILQKMVSTTMDNLDDFGEYEGKFIARVLNGQEPLLQKIKSGIRLRRMGVGLDTGRGSKSLHATLKQFINKKSKEISNKARTIAIQNLDRATAETQLKRVGHLIKVQAKSLAATIVNHTASVAKDITYGLNRLGIKHLLWSSILDQNTTDYCRAHNGQVYQINEGPRPPAHFNCRSLMIPVFND